MSRLYSVPLHLCPDADIPGAKCKRYLPSSPRNLFFAVCPSGVAVLASGSLLTTIACGNDDLLTSIPYFAFHSNVLCTCYPILQVRVVYFDSAETANDPTTVNRLGFQQSFGSAIEGAPKAKFTSESNYVKPNPIANRLTPARSRNI